MPSSGGQVDQEVAVGSPARIPSVTGTVGTGANMGTGGGAVGSPSVGGGFHTGGGYPNGRHPEPAALQGDPVHSLEPLRGPHRGRTQAFLRVAVVQQTHNISSSL